MGGSLDIEHLHRLARDRSRQGQGALVAAIADLYTGGDRVLTEPDRQAMAAIILQLLNGIEATVREALAVHFADRADAPRELVAALARDEIGVAYPLLARSDVLRDADLIEVVLQRTMAHQLAVAARRSVSEPVSEALVATANPTVIVRLLQNDGAHIGAATMSRLVDESARIDAYQEPLVGRGDLPPALVKKLYWCVSAALRQHLVKRHGLDPDTLDDALEATVGKILNENPSPARPRTADAITNDLGVELLELLRSSKVDAGVDRLAALTAIRPTLLRRFMFEPGGESFAVCCRALGIGKADFLSLFILCRQGRLGDKRVDEMEVRNVATLFDKIELTSAHAMVRYWQRDANYLSALQQTTLTAPEPR